MLETPKAVTTGKLRMWFADEPVKMSPDIAMDNEQATLRIATLYMCEGHFSLHRSKDKRNTNPQLRVEVGFTNSEPCLIDYVCSWLKVNALPHFLRECTGTKRPCYQVVIQNKVVLIRLINIIEPYLLGEKKAQARIIRDFLIRRIARTRTGSPKIRAFDEVDEAMFLEKQSIRESSEATRAPSCSVEHRTLKTWSTP